MINTTEALTLIYKKYEAFVANVDSIFNKVKSNYEGCVTCKVGCNDCCYAFFDLSFMEAIYINTKFNRLYGNGDIRTKILDNASDIDRKNVKIKKVFFKQMKESSQEENINSVMEHAARVKLKCPLLSDDGQCVMYEYRPVTCRLYGAPTAIGDKTYVCGKTRFNKGQLYETIYLEKIQSILESLSLEAQLALNSRFTELHKVYVPISMALLTKYDTNYLGISCIKEGEVL